MKQRLLFLLLISILYSCTKNAEVDDAISHHDSETRIVFPKISKDISILSADDAVKVANIYLYGNVLTKSETLKSVESVIPISDDLGRTLLFVVNYDDGYSIVSATKNYYPVLAIVDHGTYADEKSNTGLDVLINEYIIVAKAAMDGKVNVGRSYWSEYEEVTSLSVAETKVSDAYLDVVDRYSGEWYQAGYNIYRLLEKPENMPEALYAEFCENASFYDRPDHDYMYCSFIIERNRTDVSQAGPLCQMTWGQGEPYNGALMSSSMRLGCATVAEAQVMATIEYPTYIDWAMIKGYHFPETECSSVLSHYLAEVRASIGGDVINGGALLSDVKYSMKFDFGYNKENDWSLDIIDHTRAYITPSLDDGIPAIMSGSDASSNIGHIWVCDGYRNTLDFTCYSLFVIPVSGEITELQEIENREILNGHTFFYHMNWGNYGQCDGYYLDNKIAFSLNGVRLNFSQNREDLIISHE